MGAGDGTVPESGDDVEDSIYEFTVDLHTGDITCTECGDPAEFTDTGALTCGTWGVAHFRHPDPWPLIDAQLTKATTP